MEALRGFPLRVNLIVDGSGAFAEVAPAAKAWLFQNIVDGVLAAGDRITIWSAGETAALVLEQSISGAGDLEAVRQAILELPSGGGGADFSSALEQAASEPPFDGVTHTLLVSSTASFSFAFAGVGASLLRISRVEEFPGWRALVVGLNVESRVREAARDLQLHF